MFRVEMLPRVHRVVVPGARVQDRFRRGGVCEYARCARQILGEYMLLLLVHCQPILVLCSFSQSLAVYEQAFACPFYNMMSEIVDTS